MMDDLCEMIEMVASQVASSINGRVSLNPPKEVRNGPMIPEWTREKSLDDHGNETEMRVWNSQTWPSENRRKEIRTIEQTPSRQRLYEEWVWMTRKLMSDVSSDQVFMESTGEQGLTFLSQSPRSPFLWPTVEASPAILRTVIVESSALKLSTTWRKLTNWDQIYHVPWWVEKHSWPQGF